VLRWIRQAARTSEAGGAFRSLSAGMGELVEGIRRRLPTDAVRVGSPVTTIEKQDGWWRVTTTNGRIAARAVILACPAHAAAAVLQRIDPRASEICGQVRYVSTVSVSLGWRREAIAHPLEGSGFVVARASNTVRITAVTWVSSKWEGRVPAGHALLRAYLGGAHDPSAVDLPDDQLIDIAVRELSAILSITGPPSVARVYRWRAAGAQHEVGHLARVAELEERLARYPGLFITGSGFRSIGVPDCVADGRAVAGNAGTFAHET
jgi:protoporphyrinogen/coproporphyrinogen III oxidase